jgi:signal transduction histidine kinase
MRPLVLFYLLVIYVLLQFSWWAYLLIELNNEVVEQKTELFEYQHQQPIDPDTDLFTEDLRKRRAMVIGEGMVFLAILIVGIYKTRRSFNKEFALARQQKNFLLSITHEFKSPLAAVKLNLQTIQKRDLDAVQRNSIITRALNETDRINNLIENALLAARIESHSFQMHPEEFNLTDCIASTVQSRHIPGMEQRKIIQELEDNIYITGDALAISSLILNLLENAEKYSPESQPITVKLSRSRSGAVITVADQGIGISDTEKSKIFDKFYRVGNEDTRNTKGTGLGLFIVRHIVDLHNGIIEVSDNLPVGSVFKVILPLEKGQ